MKTKEIVGNNYSSNKLKIENFFIDLYFSKFFHDIYDCRKKNNILDFITIELNRVNNIFDHIKYMMENSPQTNFSENNKIFAENILQEYRKKQKTEQEIRQDIPKLHRKCFLLVTAHIIAQSNIANLEQHEEYLDEISKIIKNSGEVFTRYSEYDIRNMIIERICILIPKTSPEVNSPTIHSVSSPSYMNLVQGSRTSPSIRNNTDVISSSSTNHASPPLKPSVRTSGASVVISRGKNNSAPNSPYNWKKAFSNILPCLIENPDNAASTMDLSLSPGTKRRNEDNTSSVKSSKATRLSPAIVSPKLYIDSEPLSNSDMLDNNIPPAGQQFSESNFPSGRNPVRQRGSPNIHSSPLMTDIFNGTQYALGKYNGNNTCFTIE